MATGSIVLFKQDRGYGFIRPQGVEGNHQNVYVHILALQESGIDTVTPGQRVSYELHTGDDGKVSAKYIVLLD